MTEQPLLTLQLYSSLSLDEQQIANQLLRTVFGTGFDPVDWAPVDWITRLFADGQLVSHVSITDRICDAGGKSVRIGGIGGVSTLPEYRGRGYATLLMQKSAAFMRQDMQVDFGLLFCGAKMEPFYHQLGWQRIDAQVYYNQPERKLLTDGLLMYLPCIEQNWPDGEVDVCGLPW